VALSRDWNIKEIYLSMFSLRLIASSFQTKCLFVEFRVSEISVNLNLEAGFFWEVKILGETMKVKVW
jgi:hypothetical protein